MKQPLHENDSMLTVFVHEMHNKLAVIRSSAGLMDFYAEKSDQQTRELLREHISQVHQTLDDLSSRVIEVSMFIKLKLTEDEKESSTNLDKLLMKIRQWYKEEMATDIPVNGQGGYVNISNEHAEIVYMSMVKLAFYLSRNNSDGVRIDAVKKGVVIISFPEISALKDDISRVHQYFSGDMSIELHSALMSVYLVNKIVKAYNGSLQLIQPGTGKLGISITVPSQD